MGLIARRRRDKGIIRGKILDAAGRLIAEHGHDGISMRKIAALIDYSPTVIYYHFRDKQSLLNALADEGYLKLAHRIYPLASESNPLKRLRDIAREVVKFALENPDRYSIITSSTRPPASTVPGLPAMKEKDTHDVHAMIVKSVREAIQGRLLCKHLQDAELVSQTFFAGIHGVITTCIGNNKDRAYWRVAQHRIDLMIDTLLHGLGGCQHKAPVN